MWKWLGGCLVVLVFLIVAGSWWGYQAMKNNLSPDGTDRVMIAGSPTRVFAALANGDSVVKWMGQGNTITTTRRGPFAAGDSLQVALRSTISMGMARRPMTWQVKEVIPNALIAFELLSDSTHRVVAIRRDSLSAVGDSTSIVSTIAAPLLDSIQAARKTQKAKSSDAFLGLTSDLIVSAFRMQSKVDLLSLKAHIENSAMPSRR